MKKIIKGFICRNGISTVYLKQCNVDNDRCGIKKVLPDAREGAYCFVLVASQDRNRWSIDGVPGTKFNNNKGWYDSIFPNVLPVDLFRGKKVGDKICLDGTKWGDIQLEIMDYKTFWKKFEDDRI